MKRRGIALFDSGTLHETEQRLFSGVKFCSAVSDQFIKRTKVVVNDLSRFEAVKNLRTDVGTATNSRRVSENLSRLFDCPHHFSLSSRALLYDFRSHSRQG